MTRKNLITLANSNPTEYINELSRLQSFAISNPGRMVKLSTGWYIQYSKEDHTLINIIRDNEIEGSMKWYAEGQMVLGGVAQSPSWHTDPVSTKAELVQSLGL